MNKAYILYLVSIVALYVSCKPVSNQEKIKLNQVEYTAFQDERYLVNKIRFEQIKNCIDSEVNQEVNSKEVCEERSLVSRGEVYKRIPKRYLSGNKPFKAIFSICIDRHGNTSMARLLNVSSELTAEEEKLILTKLLDNKYSKCDSAPCHECSEWTINMKPAT